MMTEAEKKSSRKDANHRYYMKNHSKWNGFYPKSTASTLGTGSLAAHKLDDEKDEAKAIRREMMRIGLKRPHTKYTKMYGGANED